MKEKRQTVTIVPVQLYILLVIYYESYSLTTVLIYPINVILVLTGKTRILNIILWCFGNFS